MPQLSIYLRAEIFERVRQDAATEQLSASQWITRVLTRTLSAPGWPDGFEKLFGAIPDASFTAPPPPRAADVGRESL